MVNSKHYQVNSFFILLINNSILEEELDLIYPRFSIFGVVRRLREQRYCMVQTESQYEFIYAYMVHWLG